MTDHRQDEDGGDAPVNQAEARDDSLLGAEAREDSLLRGYSAPGECERCGDRALAYGALCPACLERVPEALCTPAVLNRLSNG